jgi:hypothetical protein
MRNKMKLIRLYTKLTNFISVFRKDMYQVQLDSYISSRHPKNPGDVERLAREYEAKSRLNWV